MYIQGSYWCSAFTCTTYLEYFCGIKRLFGRYISLGPLSPPPVLSLSLSSVFSCPNRKLRVHQRGVELDSVTFKLFSHQVRSILYHIAYYCIHKVLESAITHYSKYIHANTNGYLVHLEEQDTWYPKCHAGDFARYILHVQIWEWQCPRIKFLTALVCWLLKVLDRSA